MEIVEVDRALGGNTVDLRRQLEFRYEPSLGSRQSGKLEIPNNHGPPRRHRTWFVPARDGRSRWLIQIRLAQAARMARAVSMASATSALPKVRDPYSDRLRLRLSRSKRLRAGSSASVAIDSAYCAIA